MVAKSFDSDETPFKGTATALALEVVHRAMRHLMQTKAERYRGAMRLPDPTKRDVAHRAIVAHIEQLNLISPKAFKRTIGLSLLSRDNGDLTYLIWICCK